MAPDSDFQPGSLELLCVGNRGRMLDPRRTPVTILAIHQEIGMFDLEVTAFEDSGARWRLPLEDVIRFQFAIGSAQASPVETDHYCSALAEFDRVLEIQVDQDHATRTAARLVEETARAARWLDEHSEFFAAGRSLPLGSREGDPQLCAELARYLEYVGAAELEREVAETYVSNPGSGEVVKAHRMALAELGLVPYRGPVIRDPRSVEGARSLEERSRHIVARLAFLRAMFSRTDITHLVLYRRLNFEGDPPGRRDHTFISTTTDRAVAETGFDTDEDRYRVIIMRQPVPTSRVFMTYLETEAMNRHFQEAEVVLLADESNDLF